MCFNFGCFWEKVVVGVDEIGIEDYDICSEFFIICEEDISGFFVVWGGSDV